MNLPENARLIISRLQANGHRADVVGGCVRDFLLGGEPHDYDMTTDATPSELREIFSDMRTVDTGIKHGTLTVIIDSEPYEITTYRRDGEYRDNRHPDSVSFTRRLADDLSRRDFTVNAMCYSPTYGVTDLHGGRADLEARVIRAVGDPVRRFTEDALRILRALRFAAVLDFDIEEKTAAALRETKSLLSRISSERIYTEWKKLIAGVGAYRILSEYSEVISVVIPELSSLKLTDKSRFASALPEIRELSLFAPLENPAEAYSSAMERLRCDNKHKGYGLSVLRHLGAPVDNGTDLHLLLVKAGAECALGALRLKILLGSSCEERLSALENMLCHGVCYRISDMKINGNDLATLGLGGRRIGEVLEKLLLMIACGEVENDKEKLLSAVAKIG